MTTYFISRHQGAIQWAQEKGIKIDKQQTHLDIEQIQANDSVIGTLPINLVAELTRKKATYYHLTLELPEHLRGKELTANDMQRCKARLEAYKAEKM